jgi:beta-glucosidase
MKTWTLAALLLAGVAAAMPSPVMAQAAPASRPWMNPQLGPDQRTKLLLSQMTFDEKVALLHGAMAMPFGPFKLPAGAIGSAGFIAGNERLGIPALQESDASLGVTNPMMVRGPHDMSTALPSSLALAATFDPTIAYEGGRVVGSEARSKTINVQLAGGVDLARDPRNGRNFEYAGEDPLLAGLIAGESIRGIQSQGVISTAKHYALNDQEHNRNTVDSIIGEAAARESDLLAFEIAIERGQPGSIMCSYNLVNGVYACQSDWLLNKVLKGDWAIKASSCRTGARCTASTPSWVGSISNRASSSMRRSGLTRRSRMRSRLARSRRRASTKRRGACCALCSRPACSIGPTSRRKSIMLPTPMLRSMRRRKASSSSRIAMLSCRWPRRRNGSL